MALLEIKKEEQESNGQPQSEVYQREDLFEDEFDGEFWRKVNQKQSEGLSWTRAMDEVSVQSMIQKYKDSGQLACKDPALLMLKRWPASKQFKNNPEDLLALEQTVNRFLEILLESEVNSDNKYETFRDTEDKTKKTLMHYSAELGFLHVTKTLLKKCPLLLRVKTMEPNRKKRCLLPVDLALEAENDDVAAYLIRMMRQESIQALYSWRPEDMTNPKPSIFSFKSIVANPKLKVRITSMSCSFFKEMFVILDVDNIYCFHENTEQFFFYLYSLQAALYAIFLLFLSYSLLHASTKLDPTQYSGTGDQLRGFCEIVSIVVVIFYFCEEINQMRVTTGLYTKTLAKIIQQDLTRFMAVFVVVFLPFCGALFISLRCSGQNLLFSGLGDVFLSGFRVLSEQRPIAEDYSNFNWLSILLMLAYMGTVIVVLLNILIAQMSTTYIQAKKVAHLEYDVDRILQLTRME
ncbi:hypothetical protein AWC38_SpisGene20588 [Stylophora pistillata]|uniref:Ion transport domain-containing protein n=1 Tax=Stylophora pistillata TaxID=50429 RepID=A0A2B4REG3_STYPI|nr:hypothetical protein AWC38_SpisGene20588 [Stylophora pistillata]